MDQLSTQSKYGKISEKVLRVLFKVVIDDTYYEISCTMEYVKYLKEQLKRLNKILKYEAKYVSAKNDKDKEYYKEYMNLLFDQGENFDNYHQIILDYEEALKNRNDVINKLYREIEIIKKLKN